MAQMILHVVGLRFVPEMSESDIEAHFETEVVLHERMPELVPSSAHWGWSKNHSGSLLHPVDFRRSWRTAAPGGRTRLSVRSVTLRTSRLLACALGALLPLSLGDPFAAAAEQHRTVSLVWDVDVTSGVRLPVGIMNGAAAGSSNGGPGTGHGLAANVYGNRGAFPTTAGGKAEIPQTSNLSAHITTLRRGIPALIPDAGFSGVCLLDFESMRADWNSSNPASRALSIAYAGNDTTLAKRQYEVICRCLWCLDIF